MADKLSAWDLLGIAPDAENPRDLYEQGRQDFAREALEDLATRGFAIALWQGHTCGDIRRWLEGLRDSKRWSHHDRDRAAELAKANPPATPIHHSYEDGEAE